MNDWEGRFLKLRKRWILDLEITEKQKTWQKRYTNNQWAGEFYYSPTIYKLYMTAILSKIILKKLYTIAHDSDTIQAWNSTNIISEMPRSQEILNY